MERSNKMWVYLIGAIALFCCGLLVLVFPRYLDYSEQSEIRKFAKEVGIYPNVQSVDFFGYDPRLNLTINSSNNNSFLFFILLETGQREKSHVGLESMNNNKIRCVISEEVRGFRIFEDYKYLTSFPDVSNIREFMEQEESIAKYIKDNFDIVGADFTPSKSEKGEQFYCVRTN